MSISSSTSLSKRMTGVLIFIPVLLFALLIGAAVIAAMSGHSGEQLAIDGFQRRSFSYHEAFGIRLTATDYFDRTGNLEQELARKGWITSSGKPPADDQWITVRHTTGGEDYVSDANILVGYLQMSGYDGAIDLSAWSTDHPAYAAVMWPEIQTAARGNMFLLVPDIIHHTLDLTASKSTADIGSPEPSADQDQADARQAAQEKSARESLHPFLTELYLTAGKAAQSAEDVERARFCFQQVLRLAPDHEEAQSALDELPPENAATPFPDEADRSSESNTQS